MWLFLFCLPRINLFQIEKIRFDDYNFSEEPVKLASYVSKNGNIDPDKDVLVNPTEDEFVLLLYVNTCFCLNISVAFSSVHSLMISTVITFI